MPEVTLSVHLLRRARRINPYYHDRLGWKVPAGWPDDVAGAELALRVAAFQNEQGGLAVDGILGPKTWAALRGKVWLPPVTDHLIVAGEHVTVPFPVVTWDEPEGMSFYGRGGWTKRVDPTGARVSLLVLHWDGCISSHQCFHVLLERGLSVHLMLDGDGTVYQALDLAEARAWHAGNANERSVGVEIQNPVLVDFNRTQTPARPVVTEQAVHGAGTWEHLDFHDVQKTRAVELAEVLCERLGIPQALPVDAAGDVLTGLAPRGFKGVCGHYHLSTEKPDPGLTLWPGLRRLFGETRPRPRT